ncbi:MFS transporter [Catellatospora sp. KI3]|uniref:MFS transporter n=1 Tax=Catellatospora sp. KI3 TaxID=3041620 RepID=UPI002482D286|nr:MFS transporter [Catellatospora sp. KI3]MDI1460683.1 MFS transporter [Catellatospora sp. KI3]
MFAALRHRAFRLWTGACLVSIVGTWMQVLGVNWYVLQSTRSAASMGVTVALQTLPVLLLGGLGGMLADRLPARPLLVATQAAHAALAAALAFTAYTPSTRDLPAVYAISLLGGAVTALEGPVMGRYAAATVDRAALSNALSLGSLVSSCGRILGMSLGGVIVAAWGPTLLFAGNAVSFLLVIAAVAAIRGRDLHPLDLPTAAPAAHQPATGLLAHLRRRPMVLTALALALVLGSLGRNYQVTMAAMSDGPLHAGAGGYALLSTVFAAGTVAGGLLAARQAVLGYRTLVGAALVTSALQVLAGFAPQLWSFALALVPIAAGAVLIDTAVSTRVQLDTSAALRGRVLAALAATGSLAAAAGAPLLGLLAELAGPRTTLVAAGLATTAATAAAAMLMARRRRIPVRVGQVRHTLRAALAG